MGEDCPITTGLPANGAMQSKSGRVVNPPELIMKELTDFYASLYQPQRSQSLEDLSLYSGDFPSHSDDSPEGVIRCSYYLGGTIEGGQLFSYL